MACETFQRRAVLAVVVFSALMSGASAAVAQVDASEQNLRLDRGAEFVVDGRELVTITGLNVLIESFQRSVLATTDQNQVPKVYADAAREASAAFAAEPMIASMAAAMDRDLDDAERAAVAAYYAGPGERMRALEIANVGASLEPDYQQRLAAVAGDWERDDEKREAVIAIADAVHSLEIARFFMETILRAMLYGLVAAQTNTAIVEPSVLDRLVADLVEENKDVLEARVFLGGYFTYRDADSAELAEYIAFLNSPVGQKFYAASSRALGRVLETASYDYGERIAAGLSARGI